MPRFTIANTTKGRLKVRTASGIKTLMPTQSGDFEVAASHVRYYEAAGATVTALDGEEGGGAGKAEGGGGTSLTEMDAAGLRKIADSEKIDLGDIDLDSDQGRADAAATIAAFRTIYDSGTDEMLRGQAEKKGIDLTGARTKGDVVNIMIRESGVVGA